MKKMGLLIVFASLISGCGGIGEQYLVRDSSEELSINSQNNSSSDALNEDSPNEDNIDKNPSTFSSDNSNNSPSLNPGNFFLSDLDSVEPSNSNGNSISNQAGLVGSWKVTNAGGGFPSAIGSITIYNNNGTFSADGNKYGGTYSLQGSNLKMSFSDGTVLNFNITLNGNTLRIQGTNTPVWVDYIRA